MDIYNILSSKPHNEHYLKRYYKFINGCLESNSKKTKEELGYCEDHHICPESKSCFPEYKSFKENPWNKARLTARQHFIAHCILAKCFKEHSHEWFAMIKANNMMQSSSGKQQRYFNSRIYEYARRHISDTMSESQKGEKNSQYDLVWYTSSDLEESKRIRKDQEEQYVSRGWIKGRKNKHFLNVMSGDVSDGKIRIWHPLLDTHIKIENIYFEDYIIDGWAKLKPSKTTKFILRRICYLLKHINIWEDGWVTQSAKLLNISQPGMTMFANRNMHSYNRYTCKSKNWRN